MTRRVANDGRLNIDPLRAPLDLVAPLDSASNWACFERLVGQLDAPRAGRKWGVISAHLVERGRSDGVSIRWDKDSWELEFHYRLTRIEVSGFPCSLRNLLLPSTITLCLLQSHSDDHCETSILSSYLGIMPTHRHSQAQKHHGHQATESAMF